MSKRQRILDLEAVLESKNRDIENLTNEAVGSGKLIQAILDISAKLDTLVKKNEPRPRKSPGAGTPSPRKPRN